MGRFPGRNTWCSALLVLAISALAFVSGAAAGTTVQHARATAKDTTLPTWHSFYDWPHGSGYAGWHASTTSADDYGLQPALGGQPGLWLWPLGGHKTYATSDQAEWTYTAPGTTRLKSVTLAYAWSDKLFGDYCVDIGLRDASGAVLTRSAACKPPRQSPVTLTLTDPRSNPTSTVLFFQIHVNCGGASSCSKTIPSKDPLKNGAYARLLKADMTLVDDDKPVIQPSGPLWDIRDHFIDGTQTYGVTLGSTDAGSGIVGSSFVSMSPSHSTHIIGLRIAPCDLLHRTPSLDARLCPATFSWDTSVPAPSYPEGPNTFTEGALDVADNAATQSWTIYIDRTPADSVTASGSLFDLAGQTTDGSDLEDLTVTAHDPGADTQKASGIARVWFEEVGVGTVDSSDNPDCTELICPDTYSADFSVDLSGLSDGQHTFVVKASDLVGHVSEGPTWTITIASPGDQVAPDEGDTPPDTTGTADAPGGGSAGYDPTADPDPSCDAYVDVGVSDWCSSGSDSSAAAGPAAQAPLAQAVVNPATSYAGCGLKAVFWSLNARPSILINELETYNVGAACGDYYFAHEQGPSAKDQPECFSDTRASWPSNFHAAPVFEWSTWAQYVSNGHTWFQAGVEFRNRMDANGCQPGDRWFVNELPRSWHSPDYSAQTNRAVRARIANALRGLFYGGAQVNVQGFTADVVEGQVTSDLAVYKSGLEAGYAADDFWRAVGKYVQGWAKESYNQCSEICEPGKTASAIADNSVNPYSYHEAYLAAAAPATTAFGPVKTTLRAHHFPLLNAIWNSPTAVFDSHISLKQMARVIRQQIYSARRLAATQVGAAGRIGFAWKESGLGTADDASAADQLAANLAIALRNAYRTGGTAAAACVDNDGAAAFFYGCPPAGKTGAAPNPAWNAFKSW